MRDDDWNQLVDQFRNTIDRIENPKERRYEVERNVDANQRRVLAVLHESDESPEDGVIFRLRLIKGGVSYVHTEIRRGEDPFKKIFFDCECHVADDRYSTIVTVVLNSIQIMAAMTESSSYTKWVAETRGPKTSVEWKGW